MNFRMLRCMMTISTLSFASAALAGDAPPGKLMPVWPGDAPGDEGREDKEQMKGNQIYSLVHRPTIEVFLADRKAGPRPFLLICPGGGYNVVEYDKEGIQVAKYFQRAGMSVGILKYRTARFGEDKDSRAATPRALQDAARAMRLIRAHAREWNVDPKRVGMIGFSAGAHLAASVAMHPDAGATQPPDEISASPAKPDFLGLIYGVKPAGEVTKEFPPAFLVHGCNDTMVSVAGSTAFADEIQKAGVTAELHTFAKAVHGFSMGAAGTPESAWPALFEAFLRGQGFLP